MDKKKKLYKNVEILGILFEVTSFTHAQQVNCMQNVKTHADATD